MIGARAYVEAHHDHTAPANDKRVNQAYLATREELCRGAGMGARKDYFDMTHANIGAVKLAIENFLNS
jgi:hypothetical protein